MKRLFRSKKNKVLGGVLSGIGEYFKLDPVLLRIIFIIAFFFARNFSGILILTYIIAWIILPYRLNDFSLNSEGSAKEVSVSSNNSQMILAWSLIIIGIITLLFYFIPSEFLIQLNQFIWPIIIIFTGILVLFLSLKK